MTPQYSEDSVLWRLGRAPQLAACPCTHPTKPRRPWGLEVMRSTEERHREAALWLVSAQPPARPPTYHAPRAGQGALTQARALLRPCRGLGTNPARISAAMSGAGQPRTPVTGPPRGADPPHSAASPRPPLPRTTCTVLTASAAPARRPPHTRAPRQALPCLEQPQHTGCVAPEHPRMNESAPTSCKASGGPSGRR